MAAASCGLVLLAAAWLVARALNATGFYWQDDYAHLLKSRLAWHHPGEILDVWGRPLMTLAYMPAVRIGDLAVRFTSILLTLATAVVCWRVARTRGSLLPWLAALLFLVQPLVGTLSYAAMPQTVFGFVLAVALLLRTTGRAAPAALVVSCLPAARLEGYAVVIAWAVLLLLERRPRLVPLLAVGTATWAALGAAVHGDLLWLAHTQPYGLLGSKYGAAGAGYLFEAIPVAFGPVLTVLAASYWACARRTDPLVPAAMCALLALYFAAWTLPAFQSIAAPVYLASAGVPVALCATATVDGILTDRGGLRPAWLVIPVVIAALSGSTELLEFTLVLVAGIVALRGLPARLAAAGIAVTVLAAMVIGLARTDPLKLSGVPLLANQVVKRLGPRTDLVRLSTTPAFSWYSGRSVPGATTLAVAGRLPASSLMIWDSDVGRFQLPLGGLVASGWQQLTMSTGEGHSLVLLRRR